MPSDAFLGLMIRRNDEEVTARVESIPVADLPPGDVLIRVEWSSLNYKDALACQAHPGVVRSLPHIPGIDAAGEVVASESAEFQAGESVLVTGYDLGAGQWGGFAQMVRVPADWVVPLPAGLSLKQSMIYGTAGFTAAQAVMAIQRAGIQPDAGEVIVTGSTGGVGSLSVALLSKLGYRTAAVTGKSDRADWLRELGATQVLPREEVNDESDRPMLSARWAAAIDTVGGNPLATLVRSMRHRGCVAACGLAAGQDLPLTVHPFILRGVTLSGIDSAKCPRDSRLEIWRRLAAEWRIDALEAVSREVALDQVAEEATRMLSGQIAGRTLVCPPP